MISWEKVRKEMRAGASVLLDDATLDHLVLLCQYVAAKHGQEMFRLGMFEEARRPGGGHEALAVQASPLPTRKVERLRKPVQVVPGGSFAEHDAVYAYTHDGETVWFTTRPEAALPLSCPGPNFFSAAAVRAMAGLISNPFEVTEEPVHFDVEEET